MFPFVLLMSIAGLIVWTSRQAALKELGGRVTIESATATRTSGRMLESADAKYLKRLAVVRLIAKSGKPIPRALLDDVITEAYERGDWKVVSALTPGDASASVESAESEPVKNEQSETSDSEAIASPIDAATVEEWDEFIGKLRTESPEYRTDKHVGAFHHNRERLAQLNIDAEKLADEESQRKALAEDIVQYRISERKLIDDFGGDAVQLKGETHAVTMSGILGVLKAAGPKHARSWFKNPAEREQFPHTTETFLRTNGLF